MADNTQQGNVALDKPARGATSKPKGGKGMGEKGSSFKKRERLIQTCSIVLIFSADLFSPSAHLAS